MHYTFTRMVILFWGITFGFFISCSTTENTTTPTTAEADELNIRQIENELQTIRKQIAAGNSSADLYYQKGFLLSEYAKRVEESGQHEDIYHDMYQALKRADEAFSREQLPSGNQKVDELLKIAWSNEHNQGVEIMQSDSTLESEDLEHAALHFGNATEILPDTAVSYKMEARAYYENHDLDKAITALEEAQENIQPLPAEMLEQLAFLYLENKQHSEAIAIFEQTDFPEENLNVLHGLANAYISADEHDKAVDLLHKLVESQPENIIYLQALATEYYHLGNVHIGRLFETEELNFENDLTEADSMYSRARNYYEEALSNSSGNEEITATVAQFYQNTAARYQKILSQSGSTEPNGMEEKIDTYLRAAIPLYQKLAEQNPEATKYWNNLYQVYSYLGMNSEAEEVKSKIN